MKLAPALLCAGVEVHVSRSAIGILASVVGLGAWWWATQRHSGRNLRRSAARDQGTVIFDNHTSASALAEQL
jgi:hypothetical protein